MYIIMEKHILYNGEVTIHFDTARHLYTVDDSVLGFVKKRVLGITSVLGTIAKPALMYWAVNQAIELLERKLVCGQIIDEVQKKELLEEARRLHTVRKTKAANIGTMIHEWVETYVKAKITAKQTPNLPMNEQMQNACNAFLMWEKETNAKFFHSERKVYSRKHQYAGTLDLEGEVDGKPVIIDIKTSSGIYPEMAYQTSAYLKAREEEEKKEYAERWIVRIGKDGVLETKLFKEHDKDFQAFLGALSIYGRQMELKDELFANRKI